MSQTKIDKQFIVQFEQVREQYPHTKEIVYFNCASNAPFSTEVEKAVSHYVKRRMMEGGDANDTMYLIADELRKQFAEMTGTTVEEIGLCSQTSYGLNLAAQGLPLNEGDEVLLHDKEFPAAVYAWRLAEQNRGIKIRFIDSTNSQFDIDKFKSSITSRTKVLCLSWIQFFNGYKNDLKTIGEICRSHGIYFVVDGMQGMGVEPINLNELGIDIFTAGSHKWLLSAQGGGLFYIKRSVQKQMKRPMASWLDVDWQGVYTDLFHYDKPVVDSTRQFEMGFYNVFNIVSLLPSVKLICDLGLENIQKHNYGLIDLLADYINSSNFYQITSSMVELQRSSIFTFTCENLASLFEQLEKNKIVTAYREGSIRVSVHCYNNESDINKLISVLDKFAGC